MKFSAAWALATSLLFASCASAPPPPAWDAWVHQEAQHVFKLWGQEGAGTCFPIATAVMGDRPITAFLTAKHVIDGNSEMLVLADRPYPVIGTFRHGKEDAAIVIVQGALLPVVMSFDEPSLGSKVMAMGYSLAKQLSICEGRSGHYGFCSADAIWGHSGGPVFNDQGHVIGITVRGSVKHGQFIPFMQEYVTMKNIQPWLISLGILK